MILPKLSEIVKLRKDVNMTQRELAKEVGVSPSMINQIESGSTQPSYVTASKIFQILATKKGKRSPKNAGQICSSKIVKLKETDTIGKAEKTMLKEKIDQIPIFDGKEAKGLITTEICIATTNKKSPIGGIMEAAHPRVDGNTPAISQTNQIIVSKCVLVEKKSNVVGIITSSDILKVME